MCLAKSEGKGSASLVELIMPVCTGEGGRDELSRTWLFLELQQGWSPPARSCCHSFTLSDLGAQGLEPEVEAGQMCLKGAFQSPLLSSLSSRKPCSLQQQGTERDAGLVP